jgi:hypothetical protein
MSRDANKADGSDSPFGYVTDLIARHQTLARATNEPGAAGIGLDALDVNQRLTFNARWQPKLISCLC